MIFENFKDRAGDHIAEQAQKAIQKLMESPKAHKALVNILKKPQTQEAALVMAKGVANNLVGPKVMSLFEDGGGSLLEGLSGHTDISNHVLALLGFAERDPQTLSFLGSPLGQQIIEAVGQFGDGASTQVIDGITNQAYRTWLEQNPPPLHPDKLNIPSYIDVTCSQAEATYFVCANCTTRVNQPVSVCNSCLSTDITPYKSTQNFEYAKQINRYEEWLEKSRKKQKKLNIDQGAPAEVLGVAAAVIGGGALSQIDFSLLFSNAEHASGQQTAEQIVATTLTGKTSNHTKKSQEMYRIVEKNPEEYANLLKQQASLKGKVEVSPFDSYEGSVLAENVTLQQNSKVKGSVFCTEKCWINGRNVTIEGDLVIIGKLVGNQIPDVKGKIYLVIDDEVGIQAIAKQYRISVNVISIDRAYQLAKDSQLV